MTNKYAHLSPDHLRSAIGIVNFSGHGPQSGPQNLGVPENLMNLNV